MRKILVYFILCISVICCKSPSSMVINDNFQPRYSTGINKLSNIIDSINNADSIYYEDFLDVYIIYDSLQLDVPKISIIEKNNRQYILSIIKIDSINYKYIYRVE